MNPVALAKFVILAIIFYFVVSWLIPDFLNTYVYIAGGVLGMWILIYVASKMK